MTQVITQGVPALAQTKAFSFGDSEPVLDGRSLFEYGYCPQYLNRYELPYDIRAVAKLFRATSHHTSSLVVKRNILMGAFIPNKLLNRHQFKALVINYLIFNNAYLHVVRNRLGGILSLQSRPALFMRRGTDVDRYFQVQNEWVSGEDIEFTSREILHLFDCDIEQEIYGVPDYLSSINAILLNEAATLFRRRYYKNGAHAGFILHLSDALDSNTDIDQLEQALIDSKGAGNFKNLLIYTPGGQKDGVKVIPLAEVAAKDEFVGIKLASRDDQLAGHRMPPQLLGVVPQNAGGFGDIEKAAGVFHAHEIMPLQTDLESINDLLGIEVVKFKPYSLHQLMKDAALGNKT